MESGYKPWVWGHDYNPKFALEEGIWKASKEQEDKSFFFLYTSQKWAKPKDLEFRKTSKEGEL